ncbi:MAG: ketoacyl-ACP synthase III [Actinomycetota bacterium]|nr:ketoacyl-ACP synthase III [Actinomycetota bacterium]
MALSFTTPNQHSRIYSVGAYRPERIVPNSEIVDQIDSSDEWIRERSGIQSRRFAGKDESVIFMAKQASLQALERAGISAQELDAVILATISYPYQTPSGATELLQELGAPKPAAFDISAACAGFCYGVGMAADLIRSGTARYVLVVGVERLSDYTDENDRGTAFIFADGAGAVVIGPSVEAGIGPMVWGSDADNRDAILLEPSWLEIKEGSEKKWPDISMVGQKVFRWAVFEMAPIAVEAMEKAGVTADTLGAFIPHQANIRIIEAMAKAMKLPESVAIAEDVRLAGNTSAASIPLAMDALLQQRPDLHGKSALMIGFGAGLVYAGQVALLPPLPTSSR